LLYRDINDTFELPSEIARKKVSLLFLLGVLDLFFKEDKSLGWYLLNHKKNYRHYLKDFYLFSSFNSLIYFEAGV